MIWTCSTHTGDHHKRCPPPHAPDTPNCYPAISTDPRSGPYFDLPTALAPGLTLAPIRSQPAADLCEEHREGLGGGWRPGEGLGAGCVEFHQRQPSHDHCVACALPPPTAPARRAFSPSACRLAAHTLPLAPGPPPITANTYLLHSIRRNVWRRQRSAWRHASWAWRFLPGTRL